MPRRVKDFIDISEYTSLDDLIRYLETIRDNLPPEHQAELKIRGDEVFGRRLTVTYFREQTPEEAELENKYVAGDGSIEDLEDGASLQLGRNGYKFLVEVVLDHVCLTSELTGSVRAGFHGFCQKFCLEKRGCGTGDAGCGKW